MNAIESRVPFATYAAMDGLNISRLKELRRSPQHYVHRIAHPKRTDALTLGLAAHVAVLEPERFDRDYAVWSERTDSGRMSPRNGRKWETFQVAAAGREILTEDEADEATRIALAVRSEPAAMKYLQQGDPEVTLQWMHLDRPCKGRVDWLTRIDGRDVIVGLKTTRDCRHFAFASQAAKLGYHLQWGWYFDGYVAITTRTPRLVEIVVENEAPNAVAVYTISDDIVAQGRDEYLALLDQLEECERTDLWPGPAGGVEQELSLPSWVYGTEASDDLSEVGLEA